MRWMIILYFFAFYSCGSNGRLLQQDEVHLSTPIIEVDSTFFLNSCTIKSYPPPQKTNVHIRNQKSIERHSSERVKLEVNQSCKYDFWISGSGFLSSPVVPVEVFKVLHPEMDKITYYPPPSADEPYPGSEHHLFDLAKGTTDFRTRQWRGYKEGYAEILVKFSKPELIKSLIISALVDHNSWIFEVEKIEVTAVTINGQEIQHTFYTPETTVIKSESSFQFSKVAIESEESLHQMHLKIYGLEKIPDGHPGVGQKSWLFLDEIAFLNE